MRIESSRPTSHRGRRGTDCQSDDYFQTQVALLKGRALAARVIQNLGLERNPNFVVSQRQSARALRGWLSGNIQAFLARSFELLQIAPPPRQTSQPSTRESELGVHPRSISRYLSLLSVGPILKTQLVTVSFSTVDPDFSEQLANAHAAAFIRKNLETRFELTKEAREFLDKKLAELKSESRAIRRGAQSFPQDARGRLCGGE